MANFIRDIKINNFKSIDACDIKGCERINLFIGRPNVGKSNILEALSSFSIPFLTESTPKKLSSLIRIEHPAELFYNGHTHWSAVVATTIGTCAYDYSPKIGLSFNFLNDNQNNQAYHAEINEQLSVKGYNVDLNNFPIKKYAYKQDVKYKSGHSKYLIPPFGPNLLNIINEYPTLKSEIIDLFSEYRLEIAFDQSSRTMKIIKQNDDSIFLIPYNSIADTLQRIIFFKSAIASNNDSILLFEEPEAHSFPPYMNHITQEMIHKTDNQYFIATHSPFILNDFLENARQELAVFIVHYENQSTQVRKLTPEDLHDIYQNGVDLFTNSESFL